MILYNIFTTVFQYMAIEPNFFSVVFGVCVAVRNITPALYPVRVKIAVSENMFGFMEDGNQA